MYSKPEKQLCGSSMDQVHLMYESSLFCQVMLIKQIASA
jgi:hypothetical protein